MAHKFLDLVSTPSVKRAQEEDGSRASYARLEGGETTHDRLGAQEAAFIAARDSFYMASVSESGWPYVQHRGGAPGFVRVLDEQRLAFADYRGNRQHVSAGNLSADGRAALILMDYPNQRRLKILGRARIVTRAEEPAVFEAFGGGVDARAPQRAFVIAVEAFDWNCPKFITPRFTEAEVADAVAPLRDRLAALESENRALKEALKGAAASPEKLR